MAAKSMDYLHVLIIIDYFTRYIIAVPLKDSPKAVTTARIIINDIVCKHGCPDMIHTDNGSHFGAEVDTVCKMLNIRHFRSPAETPESNGLTERAVGIVKSIVATGESVSKHQNQWLPSLQPAVFAHNTSVSADTGISPFFALYGREPRLPGDMNLHGDGLLRLDDTLSDDPLLPTYWNQLTSVHRAIRLLHDGRAELEANARRAGKPFRYLEPGQLVYLLSTQATRAGLSKKSGTKIDSLLKKYSGPYTVIRRVGLVLYVIKPTNRERADEKLVHVSRLKLFKKGAAPDGSDDRVAPPAAANPDDQAVPDRAQEDLPEEPAQEVLPPAVSTVPLAHDRVHSLRNREVTPQANPYSERLAEEDTDAIYQHWFAQPRRHP